MIPDAEKDAAKEPDRRQVDRSSEGISRRYGDALRAADGAAAERVAFESLQEGMGMETLYGRVIAPAMWRIGCLWEEGAITVADEHLATAITHRVMASAYGTSFGRAASRPGRILLAAVEGQRHALGLRMAADVLELAGYEVNYVGEDVPLDALVAAIESRNPDLVGLSSTLDFDSSSLGAAVSRVARSFPGVPIILGGQGVSDEVLGEGQVVRAPGVEGLVAQVEALLGQMSGVSTLASSQPEPTLIRAVDESPEGLLLEAATDASDLARTHARMAHAYRRLAYEDPITKGPNRRAFDDRLAALEDSSAATPVTILMLDLDHFKEVNDTFGHAAGDEVLHKVFLAIKSRLREGDFAARLGGDEFALILPHTETSAGEAIAGRLLEAIRLTGGEESLTATVGVAPLDKGPRRAMLEADLALYRAKAEGGDSIGVAEPD
ncbi:MAG TPA: diguanylate cyclase [Solirubrobacterales bacterium]|nr:diguanylate cyclase [Solirubrobacterales bacterium]